MKFSPQTYNNITYNIIMPTNQWLTDKKMADIETPIHSLLNFVYGDIITLRK